MSDIQVRNRYKKEIDILINRLSVLQEQEKSYTDLTSKIEKTKKELDVLKAREKDANKIIEDKNNQISELWKKIKLLKWDLSKIDKDILKTRQNIEIEENRYIKQQDIYEAHLDKLHATITKSVLKSEEFEQKMKEKEQEYYEYVSKIDNEKLALFEKVENNEVTLKKQEEKKQELEYSFNKKKKEYNELDNEYQKLLENYIIKQ